MNRIDDHFDGPLDPRWARATPGGGEIAVRDSTLRMALPTAHAGRYSDAQIDDYTGLPLAHYPWRPPLRMTVRARFSHPITGLHGTAGFGFWNYPLSAAGGMPRLPDAVWFFAASRPSNMALVPGQAGWGWKAQVVHAARPRALAALVPTAATVLWARLTGREDAASRWVRRISGAHEAALAVELTAWHEYVLDWEGTCARFWVDGALALDAPDPPRGPLGFVAWIDNQYAVATPRGALRFGTIESGPQWLELDVLRIEPL